MRLLVFALLLVALVSATTISPPPPRLIQTENGLVTNTGVLIPLEQASSPEVVAFGFQHCLLLGTIETLLSERPWRWEVARCPDLSMKLLSPDRTRSYTYPLITNGDLLSDLQSIRFTADSCLRSLEAPSLALVAAPGPCITSFRIVHELPGKPTFTYLIEELGADGVVVRSPTGSAWRFPYAARADNDEERLVRSLLEAESNYVPISAHERLGEHADGTLLLTRWADLGALEIGSAHLLAPEADPRSEEAWADALSIQWYLLNRTGTATLSFTTPDADYTRTLPFACTVHAELRSCRSSCAFTLSGSCNGECRVESFNDTTVADDVTVPCDGNGSVAPAPYVRWGLVDGEEVRWLAGGSAALDATAARDRAEADSRLAEVLRAWNVTLQNCTANCSLGSVQLTGDSQAPDAWLLRDGCSYATTLQGYLIEGDGCGAEWRPGELTTDQPFAASTAEHRFDLLPDRPARVVLRPYHDSLELMFPDRPVTWTMRTPAGLHARIRAADEVEIRVAGADGFAMLAYDERSVLLSDRPITVTPRPLRHVALLGSGTTAVVKALPGATPEGPRQQALSPGTLPVELARHPYYPYVVDAAERYALPGEQGHLDKDLHVRLLFAMMRVESGLDPYALSPKSASGLMQLMPSTYEWRWPYSKHPEKQGRYRYDTIFDPEMNIDAGAEYLQHLAKDEFRLATLERRPGSFDQDALATVLRAYNAGPGNEKRGRAERFPETVNYVKSVTRNLEVLPSLA